MPVDLPGRGKDMRREVLQEKELLERITNPDGNAVIGIGVAFLGCLAFWFFIFSLIAGCVHASELTKQFEGYSAKIYLCPAGARTVGYGFNIDSQSIASIIPPDVLTGKRKITRAEADEILSSLYIRAEAEVSAWIGPAWANLNKAQKEILADMAYNMGIARLSKFRKMKAAILAGDYAKAAAEMKDSAWFGQTGRRAKHHVRQFAL